MRTLYMLVKTGTKKENITAKNLITTSKTKADADKKQSYWNQFYNCETLIIND